jgi:uncharacterized protein (UPF0333 family)
VSRQKNQIGSVHLIIVLLLVLALIGSLGFIAYQNFFQEKESKQSTEAVNKANDDVPAIEDHSTSIAELGVKGIYEGTYGFKYAIDSTRSEKSAILSSDDFAGACAGQEIIRISKLSSGDILTGIGHVAIDPVTVENYYNSNASSHTGPDAFIKKIGQYYYFYAVSKTDACDTPADDLILGKIIPDIHNYFLSLESN